MEYNKLNLSDSARVTEPNPRPRPKTRLRRVLLLTGGVILAVAAACAISMVVRSSSSGGRREAVRRPTEVIREACGVTRFPELCIDSLVEFPGVEAAKNPKELGHMSVNFTLGRFGQALSQSTEMAHWGMNSLTRSAYQDCLELLEDSVHLLAQCLTTISNAAANQRGRPEDVMTWLSGAMTNHETCTEGLNEAGGKVKSEMVQSLKDLSQLVSNCLAIYTAANQADFSGIPIQNRRLLESEPKPEFPKWLSRSDRELLSTPTESIQADIIVAQDGSGSVKTIAEAIKKAPQESSRRIIIHVKAGTYAEPNLKVGRKKTNLWFLGEGKGRTVITGQKSVGHDQLTTFHTASFAATGTGFLARDISFVNEAGPGNHQAVALRVGADHAVVYRCEVKGYQDTLYVHSLRQFFRECDIYGTVDFIFGNAAVVFQQCNMWARKPMPQQKITITAQNRKDPNQNTGMSFQGCEARATTDLESVKSSYPTYLGRPWKIYSRVVYMESYLGDHIDPRGWLEWNATSPVDKLYYGEYANLGPRGDVSQRVKWSGFHAQMGKEDAEKFTVAQFIFGQAWITATGVAYQSGLSA